MAEEADSPVPEGAAVFPLIPPELGVHPLLLAVLHAVVFLEGSAENIIDPAAADEARQFMAGYLQRLSGLPLRQVREDMNCLSAYARQAKWPKPQQQFLDAFLDDYGIEGEIE
jgi:hypothetical protein